MKKVMKRIKQMKKIKIIKARINKTKKHPSLSTLKGYEVASLFNLSSIVPIAPLLKNSGSS